MTALSRRLFTNYRDLQQVIFVLTLVGNVVSLLNAIGTFETSVPPAYLPLVKASTWAVIAAQPVFYLASRKLPRQPVYTLHTLAIGVTIYLLSLSASPPLAELLSNLVLHMILLLFVGLILLRPRRFILIASAITLANIVTSLVAMQQDVASHFVASAVNAILISVIALILLSAATLLINHHLRELERAQRALQDSNARLEAEVEERAGIIEQQQQRLYQASKMEALGTLAGGVAHDFNNLLTGIRGSTDLLAGECPQGDAPPVELEIIGRCVDSATKLTGQLLGFARGGKYEVVPCGLHGLIDHCLELFERTHRQIRIEREYLDGDAVLEADRAQLELVLLNLFTNAAQAMPEGGTLSVRTAAQRIGEGELAELPAGDYLAVWVRDQGHGMDEDTRRRVFEPFFTTKPKETGTGLGLASAFGIVRHHGGLIDVDSEPGQGATFRILLPASSQALPTGPETREAASHGGGRVLVVDDEEVVRLISQRVLQSLDYQVECAEDGEQALEIFGQDPTRFDLVLLDMTMPGLSGAQVFDAMVKLHPAVRVLLVSGHSYGSEVGELLKRGCRGFLGKPYNRVDLASKVLEALAEGQARSIA